jgi:hypothetical protein
MNGSSRWATTAGCDIILDNEDSENNLMVYGLGVIKCQDFCVTCFKKKVVKRPGRGANTH